MTTIKSVEKALRILTYLATNPRTGPTEIAKELKYNKSVVIRLLKTMVAMGFVHQANPTGAYSIGPRVLELAHDFLEQESDLVSCAVDQVRALWQKYGETVGLYVRDGDVRICIYRLESTRALRHSVGVGQVKPLSTGASGKVFLAYMSQPELASLIARSKMDAARVKRLQQEFPAIRRKGIAYSHGEREPGVSSLAAPILNAQGAPIAALFVSGPTQRLTSESVHELAESLSTASHIIHRRMIGASD